MESTGNGKIRDNLNSCEAGETPEERTEKMQVADTIQKRNGSKNF